MQSEEIKCIMRKYQPNQLVFWLGSGIDRDAPTALPLGIELTDEILKRTCGDTISNRIVEQWKKSGEVIQEVMNGMIEISQYPRLETILEAVRVFEEELFVDNTVMNGLRSFSEAPPNESHYILAELLHLGANIVTTNYDSCIPKAYNSLFQCEDEKMTLNDEEDLWVYKSKKEGVGKIYHLHGVAQCIKNIGATLSIVKNPIAESFDTKMDEWLGKGYCFIFLGYGGVDSLDITPYLQSKKGSKNSLGIYVRHSNIRSEKKIVCANNREENLMKCFASQYVFIYNTKDFLRDYTEKNYESKVIEISTYDWIERFSVSSKEYTIELQKWCALGIIELLNLSPYVILGEHWIEDYYNKLICNVSKWYMGNYGFRNCLRCGKKKEAYRFAQLLKKNRLLKSDMLATKFAVVGCLYEWCFIEIVIFKTYQTLKKKEIVDWRISTPINRAVFFILSTLAICPLDVKFLINRLRRKGLRLIKVLESLINAGPLYMLEINQLNVAYVDLGILEMVFCHDYKKAYKHFHIARYNYAEISSISGIINTLFYEIIYYEFLYLYKKNEESMQQAINLYDKMMSIINKEDYREKYEKFIKIVVKLGEKAEIKIC